MTNRISVTSRDDFDRSNSDPAATPDNSINERGVPTVDAGSSSSTNSPSEAELTARRLSQRMGELRIILPDLSDEELLAMIRENDRASNNTRQSSADAATAAQAAESAAPAPSTPGGGGLTRASASSSRRSRRSWQPCQPAPSRPGVFSVGGPIETGGTFNIGETDEVDLQIKRIEAVSQVQEALNEKLGYNLRESGKYENMERLYQEGERLVASTGLERREKKLMPAAELCAAPPVSRSSMMKKEPELPNLGDPLPLPSFGGEGMQSGVGSDLCLGKFVDSGPEGGGVEEDEQKREESLDGQSWTEVPVDSSPPGPYDIVVRCSKCRAGLRVHLEVCLVACPRCRAISPATDIVT